jgi:nitroimidazol reductase NimA-like FMN-containing flavoprotein (pyridoxamine 5'-phosphate oxidase superfamily)
VSTRRIVAAARRLLDASTLCAISTVSSAGRPHVHTAYFAWSGSFDLYWMSDPASTHSRNLRAKPAAAIAVYDSGQTWGRPDRGLQLFGSAREAAGAARERAERTYADRFAGFRADEFEGFRLYRCRPRRLKVFDETTFGSGVFVTASVSSHGRVAWARTEITSA